MGDLWHENIIVSTDQHALRLYILDWELARTGLPGSEIGLFCACMDLLAKGPGRLWASVSGAEELLGRLLLYFKSGRPSGAGYFGTLGC